MRCSEPVTLISPMKFVKSRIPLGRNQPFKTQTILTFHELTEPLIFFQRSTTRTNGTKIPAMTHRSRLEPGYRWPVAVPVRPCPTVSIQRSPQIILLKLIRDSLRLIWSARLCILLIRLTTPRQEPIQEVNNCAPSEPIEAEQISLAVRSSGFISADFLMCVGWFLASINARPRCRKQTCRARVGVDLLDKRPRFISIYSVQRSALCYDFGAQISAVAFVYAAPQV